jgi:hypothetical protein
MEIHNPVDDVEGLRCHHRAVTILNLIQKPDDITTANFRYGPKANGGINQPG